MYSEKMKLKLLNQLLFYCTPKSISNEVILEVLIIIKAKLSTQRDTMPSLFATHLWLSSVLAAISSTHFFGIACITNLCSDSKVTQSCSRTLGAPQASNHPNTECLPKQKNTQKTTGQAKPNRTLRHVRPGGPICTLQIEFFTWMRCVVIGGGRRGMQEVEHVCMCNYRYRYRSYAQLAASAADKLRQVTLNCWRGAGI